MTALADAPDQRTRLAADRAPIAATAFDLARRHGLDGFTVDDVVRVAGTSRRVFFDHYASREEAVADVIRVRLRTVVQEARETTGAGGAAAMVAAGLRALLAPESVETFRALAALTDADPALAGPVAQARADVIEHTAVVMRSLADEDLAPSAREILSHAVPGAVTATVIAVYEGRLPLREADGDVPGAVSRDDVVDHLVRMLPAA